jgi:hypothetical protein
MRRLGLVLVVLLMAAPAGLAALNTPPGFSVASHRPLRADVEYLTLARTGSPAAFAHVAHIPPGAPVDLRVISSHDRITRTNDDRELTSSMCARVNCVVGVNGDFWDYQDTKQPLGGVVSGGRMLRSPAPGHPQVTLTRDGRLSAGDLNWSARAGGGGTVVTVNGINRSPLDGVVLFTPVWGDETEAGSGVELVLSGPEAPGALNREILMEATGLRSPGGALAPGGAVLRGTGMGEDALRRLWAGLAGGDRRVSLTVSSPLEALESIGGHPVLLRGGQKVFPAATDDFTVKGYHRTVIGWNAAGDVFMVAVDDGTSDSKGMSLADTAAFLLGLGATEAVNLDGGGGTAMAVDGVMVNRPRTDDGDIERPAGNALVAVPRGAGPPPSPPPVSDPPVPGPTHQDPPAVAVSRSGYWMVGSDGAVYAFGDARHLGNAPLSGGAQAVDLEPTPSSNGYWIVDDNGNVFSFGDARHLGNAERSRLVAGERVSSLSATPSGNGYWFFTSRGRVLPMGDAQHYGDMSAIRLNGPVLDSIRTASGRGYYMVASDGGIFTFGDAAFHGSTGHLRLNAPVQSLVPDPDGVGYWLVASDGGVFSFAGQFRGSMGGQRLNKPMTGMVPYGNGYLMVAEDGGIFNFSDKVFRGSLGATPPARPVVAVAALR